MAKPVVLTHVCCELKCETYEEDVFLLEMEDPIYLEHSDSCVWLLGTFGTVEHELGVISAGLVMFEDDDGLFGLLPELIISIKER